MGIAVDAAENDHDQNQPEKTEREMIKNESDMFAEYARLVDQYVKALPLLKEKPHEKLPDSFGNDVRYEIEVYNISEIHFLLRDLNHDGVSELLIGGKTDTGMILLDAFMVRNRVVERISDKLLFDGYRVYVSLYDNNQLVEHMSAGMQTESIRVYVLQGEELINPLELSSDNDGYYKREGLQEEKQYIDACDEEGTVITEQEYISLCDMGEPAALLSYPATDSNIELLENGKTDQFKEGKEYGQDQY